MAQIMGSTSMFPFENNFDFKSHQAWMQDNWKITFYLSGIYITVIFGLKYIMQSRRKFDLEGLLFFWNLCLAGFSIVGMIRILPEFLDLLSQPDGLKHSVCFRLDGHSNVWAFWFYAFIISKVFELGDTIFVVLRKNPLMFLHWYHHITVLIYCWYTYSQYASYNRWFVAMNFTIHSIMYSYYALKALRVKIPKAIAASITSLQILQMLVGMFVNIYALRQKLVGGNCDMLQENILWALAMYTSYFALFAQFFAKSYLRRGEKRVSKLE